MNDTQTVYQAIKDINQTDNAQIYLLKEKTGFDEQKIKDCLIGLLEENRITAQVIPSTGKHDYGEPLEIFDIKAW